MMLRQGLMLLLGCVPLWGCNGWPIGDGSKCARTDMRHTMAPGTKIPKDQQGALCECEEDASEASPCCYGCPYGDAVNCLSRSMSGVNVCAGRSSTDTPDPRCSVLDPHLIIGLNYPPYYQGNGLVGAAPFKWEWFNPQPVDVPPSQALVQSGDLQDTVLLVAESLNGNHYADAPTGWTQTLKPCDHPEAEATLTLNEPTYWSVTLQNLPGVMPFTQVSLSEPFGE